MPSLRPVAIATALAVLATFTAPRAAAHSPHDVTPVLAVSPDYVNDGLVFAGFQFTEYKLIGRSIDGGRSWALYSNAMTVDTISDIEFSPEFVLDDTIFATTFGGGAWRSTDRGLTWAPVNAGLTNLMVRDLAVSPSFGQDRALVVATNGGLFVSQDAGDSWTPSSTGLVEPNPTEIAFDARGLALYAGTTVLHRSVDLGVTWVPVKNFGTALSCIAFDPSDLSDMTLAVSFGRFGLGVLFSTDGGATFQAGNEGLTDMRIGNVRFAEDGSVLAVSFTGGCHVTAAPFGTWLASAEGLEVLSILSDEHFFLALPSPGFPQDGIILMATFEGFYLSYDSGQSWQQQETYSLRLNRNLAYSPTYADDGLVFASGYGSGVLVAGPPGFDPGPAPPVTPAPLDATQGADLDVGPGPAGALPATTHAEPLSPVVPGGSRWTARSTGMHTIWGSELQFSPTYEIDGTLYFGHIGIYRTTDRGFTWEPVPMPPGMAIVRALALSADYAHDQTLFTGGGEGQGVFRSTDAGQTWVELTGQGGLDAGARPSVIAVSSGFATDDTLFMSTTGHGLWRSTDRGDTWVALGFDEEQVRSLALSPAFPQDGTLFVGMDSLGAFRSTDGGDTWDPVDFGIADSPNYTVQSFGFSPRFRFDGEVFALTRQGHVRFSTNHGVTWEARETGLTDQALRALAVSPSYRFDSTLLVSSHDWIWESRDKGLSWSRLPGWIRVDDTHQSARVSGTWATHAIPGSIAENPIIPTPPVHHGPGVRVTQTVGDWTELEFYGTSAAFYAELDPDSGIVQVSIDGMPAALVDLYAPVSRPRQKVYEHHFDVPGWHTLRVTLTMLANPASGGRALRSDGFHYTFDEPLPLEASTAAGPWAWLRDGRPARLHEELRSPGRARPGGPFTPSLPVQDDAHQGCAEVPLSVAPDEAPEDMPVRAPAVLRR